MEKHDYKTVLVTGGFDPIHSGHIEYLNHAAQLGDRLVVGVNSDGWLKRKKGRAFMPFSERAAILSNIKCVDEVIDFDDTDGTACDAIAKVLDRHGSLIFANGGDRTLTNIPEMVQYDTDSRVRFQFGVGGENKANSSRWILEEWKAPKTEREWGYYRVLHEVGSNVKLKELTVDPGKRLSMQRHQDRAEFWFVSEGTASVYTINASSDFELRGKYTLYQNLHISKRQWHMLANETDVPLRIIEIQYGDNCIEEDIERKYYESP